MNIKKYSVEEGSAGPIRSMNNRAYSLTIRIVLLGYRDEISYPFGVLY